MLEAEKKRQALQDHAESLMEQYINAVLTPSAANNLLLSLKNEIVRKVDATPEEAVNRLLASLPNYVGKNLVQGIRFASPDPAG